MRPFNTFQEQTLFATLRIEILECSVEKGIGTGVLISKKIRDKQFKIYLVSNKHVLTAGNELRVSFILQQNGQPLFKKTKKIVFQHINNNIIAHSNPKFDVAALDVTSAFAQNQDLFYRTINYEMFATFEEEELNIAENVLFIGFPDNRYDILNNLPLVRTGIISSHPFFDFNDLPQFVIDGQVFPGSSGSPVFIDLTYENFKNGVIDLSKKEYKLLGIISQTMIKNSEIKEVPVKTNLYNSEVIGLGIVVKATAIKELLDCISC